jgi:hypothetical protein
MKKVIGQCCGETLQIVGRRAAFVPDSITCALCVVDPVRCNPAKVFALHEAAAWSQRSSARVQTRNSPPEWLKRSLRKVFASGRGVLAQLAQRG